MFPRKIEKTSRQTSRQTFSFFQLFLKLVRGRKVRNENGNDKVHAQFFLELLFSQVKVSNVCELEKSNVRKSENFLQTLLIHSDKTFTQTIFVPAKLLFPTLRTKFGRLLLAPAKFQQFWSELKFPQLRKFSRVKRSLTFVTEEIFDGAGGENLKWSERKVLSLEEINLLVHKEQFFKLHAAKSFKNLWKLKFESRKREKVFGVKQKLKLPNSKVWNNLETSQTKTAAARIKLPSSTFK